MLVYRLCHYTANDSHNFGSVLDLLAIYFVTESYNLNIVVCQKYVGQAVGDHPHN